MRKAIQLRVTLWIEGEAEPASDFAKYTGGEVRRLVEEAAKGREDLKITVKKVEEDEGDD
ncbi:MAG: hypothetical protein JO040_11950 [Gemmatimonadetes bacterium]|nr:hypothetical protein [Gemmatimonadota bacterium]